MWDIVNTILVRSNYHGSGFKVFSIAGRIHKDMQVDEYLVNLDRCVFSELDDVERITDSFAFLNSIFAKTQLPIPKHCLSQLPFSADVSG